jgi:hypothetical protein
LYRYRLDAHSTADNVLLYGEAGTPFALVRPIEDPEGMLQIRPDLGNAQERPPSSSASVHMLPLPVEIVFAMSEPFTEIRVWTSGCARESGCDLKATLSIIEDACEWSTPSRLPRVIACWPSAHTNAIIEFRRTAGLRFVLLESPQPPNFTDWRVKGGALGRCSQSALASARSVFVSLGASVVAELSESEVNRRRFERRIDLRKYVLPTTLFWLHIRVERDGSVMQQRRSLRQYSIERECEIRIRGPTRAQWTAGSALLDQPIQIDIRAPSSAFDREAYGTADSPVVTIKVNGSSIGMHQPGTDVLAAWLTGLCDGADSLGACRLSGHTDE